MNIIIYFENLEKIRNEQFQIIIDNQLSLVIDKERHMDKKIDLQKHKRKLKKGIKEHNEEIILKFPHIGVNS